MNKPAELIIVDDHKIFREGLKYVLNLADNINVIAEASNGSEFIELLNTCKPDLVIIDISMPGMSGIEATEAALEKYPDLKIIALSMFDDEDSYNKMIKAGVKGFILKESGSDELKKAINEVLSGNSYFSQELLRKIIKNIESVSLLKTSSTDNHAITNREKEVLKHICQGMNNHEIAETLHVSHRTVEGHRANLFKKTSTKNTVNLIMHAIKNKLVELQ